jgi:hypothetical protein
VLVNGLPVADAGEACFGVEAVVGYEVCFVGRVQSGKLDGVAVVLSVLCSPDDDGFSDLAATPDPLAAAWTEGGEEADGYVGELSISPIPCSASA